MTEANLTVSPALESESTTETPDVLLFQWLISDLFEDVKLLSANLAKFAIGEKTGDQFDKIAITTEDKIIFDRYCRSAALFAYTKIQGLAKTIEPAFLFNEGVAILDYVAFTPHPQGSLVKRNDTIYKALGLLSTDPEVDTDNWEEMPDYIDTNNKVTLLILNKATYDTNVIKVWDDNLRDIMVTYILEKIFKFRNLGQDILAIVIDERMTKERELMLTINTRKSPTKRYVSWP
jgi:hypothetical protein